MRGVHQHPAGRALDVRRCRSTSAGRLLQRSLQRRDGPLLVQPRGFPGEQRMVGGLVRGAPPGPYGVRARRGALASSRAKRSARAIFRAAPDAQDDTPCAPPRACLSCRPRTTITGQSACAATVRLTEPSTHSASPLRPRVPTTSVEACGPSWTRAYSGSSGSTPVVTCRARTGEPGAAAAAPRTMSSAAHLLGRLAESSGATRPRSAPRGRRTPAVAGPRAGRPRRPPSRRLAGWARSRPRPRRAAGPSVLTFRAEVEHDAGLDLAAQHLVDGLVDGGRAGGSRG